MWPYLYIPVDEERESLAKGAFSVETNDAVSKTPNAGVPVGRASKVSYVEKEEEKGKAWLSVWPNREELIKFHNALTFDEQAAVLADIWKGWLSVLLPLASQAGPQDS